MESSIVFKKQRKPGKVLKIIFKTIQITTQNLLGFKTSGLMHWPINLWCNKFKRQLGIFSPDEALETNPDGTWTIFFSEIQRDVVSKGNKEREPDWLEWPVPDVWNYGNVTRIMVKKGMEEADLIPTNPACLSFRAEDTERKWKEISQSCKVLEGKTWPRAIMEN